MPKGFSSTEIKTKLERDGWVLTRRRGSHQQYKHATKRGLVTIPHPVRRLPTGTLRGIFRQAGWERPPE